MPKRVAVWLPWALAPFHTHFPLPLAPGTVLPVTFCPASRSGCPHLVSFQVQTDPPKLRRSEHAHAVRVSASFPGSSCPGSWSELPQEMCSCTQRAFGPCRATSPESLCTSFPGTEEAAAPLPSWNRAHGAGRDRAADSLPRITWSLGHPCSAPEATEQWEGGLCEPRHHRPQARAQPWTLPGNSRSGWLMVAKRHPGLPNSASGVLVRTQPSTCHFRGSLAPQAGQRKVPWGQS